MRTLTDGEREILRELEADAACGCGECEECSGPTPEELAEYEREFFAEFDAAYTHAAWLAGRDEGAENIPW